MKTFIKLIKVSTVLQKFTSEILKTENEIVISITEPCLFFSFYKELVHSVEKLQQSARLVAYILNFNLIYTPDTNSDGIQRYFHHIVWILGTPHSYCLGIYIFCYHNHSSSVKKVKLSWLWLFSCSKNHQFSSRYVKIRYQYDVDSSLWMDANSFFLPIVPRSSRNKLISCERRFNDFFGLSCTQRAASSTASWMRLRLLPLRSFFLPLKLL